MLDAVTAGANVWVTSSSQDKIKRAQELGAKGGVNYKDGASRLQLALTSPHSAT